MPRNIKSMAMRDANSATRSQFQQQSSGGAVAAEVAKLPGILAEAVKQGGQQPRSLVDSRGLGRPGSFTNRAEDFITWSRKTANYVQSIYSYADGPMTLAAESAGASNEISSQ